MSDCKLRAKNCGGCPLLGLDYAAQLKQKESAVRALLGKYGPVHPIRGMDVPYRYRNKVISTFAPAAGGKLTSGIYAARTHKVLPVESCLLEDEVLDKVLLAVRAAANRCRYQPYNEDRGTGLLRHCLLRRAVATGQVMVVLVTAQPVLPGAKNFVRYLLEEAETRGVPVTTVVQNYNPRQTSVVLGEAEKVLYGKGFILDTLCGKTYALSPRSFYQVNPVQTEYLYGKAIELAGLTGNERVLDAYCGIGTIGIIAAAFSNSDSALTAMTTSVCIDLLKTDKDTEETARRKRKKVHLSLSILLAFFICLVEMLNNKSVIDAIYIIASYTYGPLLGMFAFGLFTRRRTKDRLVPLIAIASPVLCYALDWWINKETGYKFGYELLMLNGSLTFAGLMLLSGKEKTAKTP